MHNLNSLVPFVYKSFCETLSLVDTGYSFATQIFSLLELGRHDFLSDPKIICPSIFAEK